MKNKYKLFNVKHETTNGIGSFMREENIVAVSLKDVAQIFPDANEVILVDNDVEILFVSENNGESSEEISQEDIQNTYDLFHKIWGNSKPFWGEKYKYEKEDWSRLQVLLSKVINKKPFVI